MARPTRFAGYPFPASGFATTKGGNINIGSNANTVVIVRGGENEVTPDTIVGCTLNGVAMTLVNNGTRSGGGDIGTFVIDSGSAIGSGSVPILFTMSAGNSRLGLCVEVWHDCGGTPRYNALTSALKSASAAPSHTVTADADSTVVLMSSVSSGITTLATAPTVLGASTEGGGGVVDFALYKDGAASVTLNWTHNFADADHVTPIKLNGVPGGPVITGNITADDATATGSLATLPPSTLTGNITAADAAPTGSLGQQLASLTTLPFTRNPGNGGRVVSIANVALAVLTDDVNLSRLVGSAGLLMGVDGRLSLANQVPAPPGTTVVVVTRELDGKLGVERYALT